MGELFDLKYLLTGLKAYILSAGPTNSVNEVLNLMIIKYCHFSITIIGPGVA
jgi:hypothetical protein